MKSTTRLVCAKIAHSSKTLRFNATLEAAVVSIPVSLNEKTHYPIYCHYQFLNGEFHFMRIDKSMKSF